MIDVTLAALGSVGIGAYLVKHQAARAMAPTRRSTYSTDEAAGGVRAALDRLSNREDADYVRSQGRRAASLVRRLQRDRRAVQGFYLKQLREEFRATLRKARELAEQADDPEIGMQILRANVLFMALYAGLQAKLALGFAHPVQIDTTPVVEVIQSLQRTFQMEQTHVQTAQLSA